MALDDSAESIYFFRLYVTGATPRSVRAIQNLREMCDAHLPGRYQLEVIDIYQQPEEAQSNQIIVTPTLIKSLPVPPRRIIGDLSHSDRVLDFPGYRKCRGQCSRPRIKHGSGEAPNPIIHELEQRLAEAEQTLHALANGEVDAVVATGPGGNRVYTLKGADEPYRLLVQEMAEGALTITIDGLILFSNQQFADTVASPLERVIGCKVYEFLDPGCLETARALMDSARRESVKGGDPASKNRRTDVSRPTFPSIDFISKAWMASAWSLRT